MAEPGQYETVFGQLGVFLARENACGIELTDQGEFIAAEWHSDGILHQQCFRGEELSHLNVFAQMAPASTVNPAALLGALGREMDAIGLNVAQVHQDVDSFEVAGSCQGRYVRERYYYQELRSSMMYQAPAVPSSGQYQAVPASGQYQAVAGSGAYPGVPASGQYQAVPPSGSFRAVAAAAGPVSNPITRRLQALAAQQADWR